jgi:S1-C subfamily serine protease
VSTILTIKHLTGSLAGRSQRVVLQEDQRLRVGRSPDSDIKFSDTLDDAVSGTHAELSLHQGRVFVEDKRSSNGTFVNGEPCPPFQKIAVPDGARIRLAKDGPEMQVLIEAAPAATAATARPGAAATGAAAPGAIAASGAPATAVSATASMPAKESVGRATLLREIDRARQEERDVVSGQLASSRRSTGMWVALGLMVVLLLTVAGIGGVWWWNQRNLAAQGQQLTAEVGKAKENVWASVEQHASPAVVHIRCMYRIRIPVLAYVDQEKPVVGTRGDILLVSGVQGSGVVIKPGLVLTAKHVAEHWKLRFPKWKDLVSEGAKAEYDLFDVQFPGQQPIKATLVASSDESDLALLQIQPTTAPSVPIVGGNADVKVTDRISVISYPSDLGQKLVEIKNLSGYGGDWTKVTEVTPTFVVGTVTHPLTGANGPHLLAFDASVTHGSSGGAVLNDKGELIGIVSMKFTEQDSINVRGEEIVTSAPVNAGNMAVSPDDIRAFLRTHGIV